MFSSRPFRVALIASMVVGAALPSEAVEWTLIDVKARLDNDGRLHVVETHHLRLELRGFKLFREFGLGADQSIVFTGLTRIEADGSEHPLAEGEVGDSEHYRYYDRGHVAFAIPDLGEGATVAYRFEYDLEHAVAPSWAIAAGPDALEEDAGLVSPWRRLVGLVADWKEAWPDLRGRYRLDHDVLFPSREGPGFVVRRIDYRLEFDRAWKQVHPESELASVKPDDHYRVRPLFQYLGPGEPSEASIREAATRLATVAALPVLGIAMWLGLLALEAMTLRRSGRVDRAFVVERLLPLAPEEIAAFLGGAPARPDPEAVLSRLASEGKIAIEIGPPSADGEPKEVRMRLLAPTAALTRFEWAFLAALFPRGRETGTALLNDVYQDRGFDPGTALETGSAGPVVPRVRRRFLPLVWAAVGGLGFVLQVRSVLQGDLVPIVVLANVVPFFLALGWPHGWWHGGRPARGLLLPLLALGLLFVAWQLAVNRPLPAPAWWGGALVVLACHAHVLSASRMPTGGPFTTVRDLARIRRFAAAELRRSNPRLDDAWISRLDALGLGPARERWRQRHGETLAPPDLSDPQAATAGPRFTGGTREPFVGPPGWTDALYVPADEENEEHAEGGEDA